MSEILIEWVPFFLFLILLAVAIFVEIKWLTRKAWTTSGRATGYVFATDLIGFGVGFFIVFTVIFIMFMMVMGPAGRGSDVPGSVYAVTSIIGLILPAIVLILIKRLFLLIFKIQSGRSAWMYSLASTGFIIMVVLIPPPLVFYIAGTLLQWK